MAIEIQVCGACGHAVFPPRLRCSRCGAGEWRAQQARRGCVEAVTVVRRSPALRDEELPLRLGLVRADLGVPLLVRLDDRASRGQWVELSADGDAIHGRLETVAP